MFFCAKYDICSAKEPDLNIFGGELYVLSREENVWFAPLAE